MEEKFIIYGKKDNVEVFFNFLKKLKIDSYVLGFCEYEEMIKNSQFYNKPIFDYQDAINQNVAFLILEDDYDKEIEIIELLLKDNQKILLRHDLINFFDKADIKFQAGLIFNYPAFLKKHYYKDYLNLTDKLNIKKSNIENKQLKKFITNSLDYDQLYNDFYEDLIKLPKYVGTSEYSDIIWWCWLQGEENAPDICKASLASVRKYFPDKEIIVITNENLYNYIDLPDYIKLKHKIGIISNAYFSDIVRLELLVKYGGTWIDSTVLVTGNADYIFNHPLFIFTWDWLDELRTIGNWIISAEINNPILKYILDLQYLYWKKYDYLFNYFIFHFFFSMISKIFPEEYSRFKTLSTYGTHYLPSKLFDNYSIEGFKEITQKSNIHKLTYRIKIPDNIENTNYKYILDTYNIIPNKNMKNSIIPISQIDSEFSIYKNNTVVLLTKGPINQELFELLKYHKIKPDYICDVNKEKWGEIIKNIPVVSPQHLTHMVKNKKTNKCDIVVQVASKKVDDSIIDKITSFEIDKIITFNEAWEVLSFMNKLKLFNENPHMISAFEPWGVEIRILSKKAGTFNYIYQNAFLKEYIFICSIQKTGDFTLKNTLGKNNIESNFGTHTPEILNKELISNLNKKVKIIVGIREPISQNISYLYQTIACLTCNTHAYFLKENYKDFFKNGGDAQHLFNLAYNNQETKEEIVLREACSFFIESFFEKFKENIIDLSQYPFDKEKGYTIIKEGNLEIFAYQLEKLNSLPKIMSDWIGQTPFDEWKNANVADDKWIANSYKQAQKEITFSQEYFDRCYNDKWIQHFYSQEDIEKFKERWKPHIR